MSSFIFALTLALYAVACALYLVQFGSAGATTAAAARRVLLAAFLVHGVDIGLHCVAGTHPFVNAREALSFTAWLMVGVYLVLTLRFAMAALGAFIVPLAIVLDAAARIVPSSRGHANTLVGRLHIGLATAAVAVLAVATGAALLYLLHERQLKRHRWGALLRRGASLEALDGLGRACLLVGFPLLTLALLLGTLLALQGEHGLAAQLTRPAHTLSAVTWLLLAFILLARRFLGWRGRRAAWLLLAGFAIILTVLGSYYQRSVSLARAQQFAETRPRAGEPGPGER